MKSNSQWKCLCAINKIIVNKITQLQWKTNAKYKRANIFVWRKLNLYWC